jgi:predicted Zn-dependent protease with MMP-like domain
MVDVDGERFEAMVSEALDGLPAELGELMSNVAVIVEHDGGPPGLLGLYQGIPLTRRTTSYAGVLPDRITIYRRAICAIARSDADVVDQVRRTVIHEVGHHFGIGDARLRELGW